MDKQYLGDGVYVELCDGATITVTTEDGIAVTNTVVLELEVLVALITYACDHFGTARLVRKG